MSNKENRNEEGVFSEKDFGNWVVKSDGEIDYNGTLRFPGIGTSGLTQQNWLTHILNKSDANEIYKDGVDFYFAYFEALKRAGYKSITISLTDTSVGFFNKD